MEEQQQTYIKGFNDGYKLAKFNPELLAKIQPSLSEGVEYDRGLIEGVKEWEQEKVKTRAAELENLREEGNKKEVNKGLEK